MCNLSGRCSPKDSTRSLAQALYSTRTKEEEGHERGSGGRTKEEEGSKGDERGSRGSRGRTADEEGSRGGAEGIEEADDESPCIEKEERA
eukprot:3146850-Amphidinium_carterae.2